MHGNTVYFQTQMVVVKFYLHKISHTDLFHTKQSLCEPVLTVQVNQQFNCQ